MLANAGGRDASYGAARDGNPVFNNCGGGLSWHRSLRRASPWTATSRRDRPAGCSTCASSLCGALCGNGDGRRRPASMVCWFDRTAARIRRRAGDDGHNARRPANPTLAATQRHPCRSAMVTADCARSRLRPGIGVAPGGTEGSAENSLVHLHLSPLARARR